MSKLKEIESLGNRLRRRREELQLSVEDVASRIQSPSKFVEALEQDNFDAFSAIVYARGYLKKILSALEFENSEGFIKEFEAEWDVQLIRKKRGIVGIPQNRGVKPIITPKRLAYAAGGIVLAVFLLFLGTRFTVFLAPPKLKIDEPRSMMSYQGPVVRIAGRAEKESRLTVNGREITMDESGYFDEEIEFASGFNAVEFLVQNRFGKTNTEKRYIYIE